MSGQFANESRWSASGDLNVMQQRRRVNRKLPQLAILVLLTLGLGVVYARSHTGKLREFEFGLRGDNTERLGDHWVLKESPSTSPLIYLEFNVRVGKDEGRGNTFPVIARRLVGGDFDFVKHGATTNEELWDFEGGRTIRLFWSCEPIHNRATKIHAVAVEYRDGKQISTLGRTITLKLAPKAA